LITSSVGPLEMQRHVEVERFLAILKLITSQIWSGPESAGCSSSYWVRWNATDVSIGSKCEELRVSKVSPLYPTKRTSMKGVATSLMGEKRTFPFGA
jgi:hypothetical protein